MCWLNHPFGRDWKHELAAFQLSGGPGGALRPAFLVRLGTI
jgi:hypothetical protein